jgi:hypothetical protein
MRLRPPPGDEGDFPQRGERVVQPDPSATDACQTDKTLFPDLACHGAGKLLCSPNGSPRSQGWRRRALLHSVQARMVGTTEFEWLAVNYAYHNLVAMVKHNSSRPSRAGLVHT